MTSQTRDRPSQASPVFVSYAAQDKEFVDKLVSDLQAAGIAVWLDQFTPGLMASGSGILEALDRACAVILVLSSASAKSVQVENEVRTFVGAPIIPVILEEVEWGLLWWAKAERPIDFRETSYAIAFQALLAALPDAARSLPAVEEQHHRVQKGEGRFEERERQAKEAAPPPEDVQTTAPTPPPPIPGRAFDVFISYKSDDASYAQQVSEFLRSQSLHVFFSRESLPQLGSDEYHQQIDLAIEGTRHMIVVTSSGEHVTAKWVQYEWRLFLGEKLAGRKSGNLMCVIAGDMKIDDLPISLRNREVVRLVPEELPRLLQYTKADSEGIDRAESSLGAANDPSRQDVAAGPRRVRESEVLTISDFVVSKKAVLREVSWLAAADHAATLSIDGQQGWRLPSLEELRLIQQASVFPDECCYWSGKEAPNGEALYMHFDDCHFGRGPKAFSKGLCAVFVKRRR